MNNAEKFAEVFGIDLPIRIFCDKELQEDCKRCIDVTQCNKWITSEYKENGYDEVHD
jgi:hypothetical protein